MKYKYNLRSTFSLKLKNFIDTLKNKKHEGIAPYNFEGGSTLFHVSCKSYIEKQILYHQNHCGYLLEVIKNFIEPNKTFLDVGANIGSISLPLANYSKNTNFHLFEPDKNIYKKLIKNINLNKLSNVFAHELALSSSIGEKNFFKTSLNSFN